MFSLSSSWNIFSWLRGLRVIKAASIYHHHHQIQSCSQLGLSLITETSQRNKEGTTMLNNCHWMENWEEFSVCPQEMANVELCNSSITIFCASLKHFFISEAFIWGLVLSATVANKNCQPVHIWIPKYMTDPSYPCSYHLTYPLTKNTVLRWNCFTPVTWVENNNHSISSWLIPSFHTWGNTFCSRMPW